MNIVRGALSKVIIYAPIVLTGCVSIPEQNASYEAAIYRGATVLINSKIEFYSKKYSYLAEGSGYLTYDEQKQIVVRTIRHVVDGASNITLSVPALPNENLLPVPDRHERLRCEKTADNDHDQECILYLSKESKQLLQAQIALNHIRPLRVMRDHPDMKIGSLVIMPTQNSLHVFRIDEIQTDKIILQAQLVIKNEKPFGLGMACKGDSGSPAILGKMVDGNFHITDIAIGTVTAVSDDKLIKNKKDCSGTVMINRPNK